MTDARIAASYERSMARNGVRVTVQRVNGQAPRTALVSASVLAIVQGYAPDPDAASRTGYGEKELGGITQGDRNVIVIAAHLAAQRFPLPLEKNDKIILGNGEQLNVVDVDAASRQLAGAVELKAAGVQ